MNICKWSVFTYKTHPEIAMVILSSRKKINLVCFEKLRAMSNELRDRTFDNDIEILKLMAGSLRIANRQYNMTTRLEASQSAHGSNCK